LSDEGNPKFSTIAKVVKALGLRLYMGSQTQGTPDSTEPAASDNGIAQKSARGPMLSQRFALNDALNKSGRQRMLSQQLAKCYLQIGQSIDAARSKQILASSSMLFERQLGELKAFAPTQEIKVTLVNLEQAWDSYKDALNSEPTRENALLVLTINEDILAMAQESTDQLEKFSKTAAGKFVNLAGRQRMLSQRMAKFYHAFNWGIAAPEMRSKLQAARKEFTDALAVLMGLRNNTADIRRELEVGKQQWSIFDKALNTDAGITGKKSLLASNVATLSERVLEVMDRVTLLYTRLA
jgi:hypothetical protein